MNFLSGVISDRLRRRFASDDEAYTPARQSAEIADMPADQYTGIELSPPGRRGGRHRKEDQND